MPSHRSITAALLLSASLTFADPGPPQGLLTNLLRHPEETVITDPHPRFSWIVNDPARGAAQSAYQIRLSETESSAPLWDSDKVSSDQSTSVPYTGPALQPNHPYYWTVRTWDTHDRPSPWSAPQRFNTASHTDPQSAISNSQSPDPTWIIPNEHPLSYHPLPPTAVQKLSPDHYFLDFGRAAFATLRLTLTSPDDSHSLHILLGEKKTPDNHVDRHPGGSVFSGSYTLKLQQGTHTYTLPLPHHVSKMPHSLILPDFMLEVEPYRYAELLDCPSGLTKDDARQLALFYPFDDTASSFTSSDPALNSIWDLCKYTLKAAPFLGTYTDGVRERMPYEADAYIQALGHYCVDREYAIERHSAEFLYDHATWPTEWILLSVLTAHADYMNTGDPASLDRNYDTLKAKLLLPLAREDGLISTRTGKVTPDLLASIHFNGKALHDITDWPPPTEIDGFQFTDYNTVVNALHYRALVCMADIAAATNHPDDATQFRTRAEKVKAAFNQTFLNPTTGIYLDGQGATHSSLHANAFPLAFGLVPDANVPAVLSFLKSRDMSCGPYGAQFLLDALYTAHAPDAALSLITNHTDRGWLHMLDVGSTMTTESWDLKYKKNLTWNHAWATAPANILPRHLMGIQPLEPGFKKILIAPQPSTLADATLTLPTIRGSIHLSYHHAPSSPTFTLDLTIPANTTAELRLPTNDPSSIRESSTPLDTHPEIHPLTPTTLELPAGTYHFTAKP